MMNQAMPRSLKALTAGMMAAPEPDIEIRGLTLDSREVHEGDLFLAMSGGSADGRDYISSALEQGAAAVLLEEEGFSGCVTPPRFAVRDLKRHAGALADRFYARPSDQLCVVGITGTNGKTTCAHLTAQCLAQFGQGAGIMGTIGNGLVDQLRPSRLTTADVVAVHRELRSLLDCGADSVCMEVSSHALVQGRVDKVSFDVAVFTNLSQDHLDYHDDMASYGEAKGLLFAWPDLAACVINIDDSFGRALAERIQPDRLWSVGASEDARIRIKQVEEHRGGISLLLVFDGMQIPVEAPLLGAFNAFNIATVFAVLLALGHPVRQIKDAFGKVVSVPGRMQMIPLNNGAISVVDYAHTPDALEKALEACRAITKGRLWLVFGCGGDRDSEKRAMMGAIASKLADAVIVTNDNPRTESPEQIVDAIRSGMDGSERVCLDRRQAIALAVESLAAEDTLLVAGKGHETGQTIGDRVYPFSDAGCIRELAEDLQ